jgi:N-methylhydantoinase A
MAATNDIALVANAEIPTTSEAWVGDERVAVKKVDSNSFEGGGGSIAWIDALGVLRIGPRSSASVPGPVCYDRGGTEPTVLDATLLLGYIAPDYYLGGEMPLRMDLAREAIARLGRQLGIKDPVQMATAIFSLANTVIAGHITKICTKRGFDPRDHVLMSAGGGGGLRRRLRTGSTFRSRLSRASPPSTALSACSQPRSGWSSADPTHAARSRWISPG